ncbi:MAG: DUF349 domain-containing protein [Prolixibacteraceae bacterium]|nr:DUF349 domain-containing protein [Prolixibacteraceae bacterium]NLO02854.1 DUF349 domain-containing protein [Bacteroidales bacterium]
MEPKDLKNSDELKSTPETENNNSDINNTEGEENLNENVAEEHENEGQPEATDDTTDSLKDNEILQSDNKKKQPRVSAQKVSIPEESSKSNAESAHYGLTDYSKFSMIELINTLRNLLNEAGEKDIKRDVESIKAHFYKKLKEDVELQKQKFIEEGGKEEDFESEENPYENDLKELLKEYRQVRIEYSKKLEQDKEINLQVKYEVIEEIKSLIHKEESINKTFQEFRELQKRWREIGLVPQSKVKDLWDTYHFHVENFYDYIKINQELRDLDLKKNLEIKIRLCEQAEELLLEPNVIKAFNSLQKLHERWRETGPVPRENKDDIWERFKAATTKINKKHQEYFEIRKSEQKKNYEAKKAICEQIEDINELELTTHKEWSEKSKEVINFQKVWRTIGFAPQKENNRIYTRFRTACDKFFDAKREFYAQNKELQQNNLQLKTDLCMQAEELKESTDWRKATNDLINIQKQWKEIGPVPRKQSDLLWKRFRAACDYFFDKKAEHFSNIDSEQIENLKLKEELIEEVTNFKATDDVNDNLEKMKEFQRRWTEIGHVPLNKKDEIQKRFREAINKLFDELNLDETERNLLKFKTKIASISDTNRGYDKMRMEREKYVNKLKQLETDLILLDNNIGFFAKSKKTESLIKDVKRKIEQTKSKIEFLKEKIRVIDEIDQGDD